MSDELEDQIVSEIMNKEIECFGCKKKFKRKDLLYSSGMLFGFVESQRFVFKCHDDGEDPIFAPFINEHEGFKACQECRDSYIHEYFTGLLDRGLTEPSIVCDWLCALNKYFEKNGEPQYSGDVPETVTTFERLAKAKLRERHVYSANKIDQIKPLQIQTAVDTIVGKVRGDKECRKFLNTINKELGDGKKIDRTPIGVGLAVTINSFIPGLFIIYWRMLHTTMNTIMFGKECTNDEILAKVLVKKGYKWKV